MSIKLPRCPKGTRRNKTTKKCEAKQTKKKQKECPEGKILNPKTNRCNKIKILKQKKENIENVENNTITPTYKGDIIQVMRNYAQQSTTKVFPYICNDDIQKLMLIQLMETNKNGCAYDINTYGLLKATNNRLEFFLRGKKLEREKFMNHIKKQYLKCAKRKRMLVVPFTVDSGRHANMIIFNIFRNEVERFEPHGSKTMIDGFNDSKINKDLANLVKQLNLDLKFIPSHKTCPVGYNAYQYYDTAERKKSNTYSVPIIDPGGYCCAWSFFYADLRLKYPRLSGADILQKSISIIGDNPQHFRRFIRGQTQYLYKMISKIHKDNRFVKYVNWYNLGHGLPKKELNIEDYFMFGEMESKWKNYVDTELKKYF